MCEGFQISVENTAFDIDSVFGDLSELLIAVAREVYGLHLEQKDFTRFKLEECLPYSREMVLQWIETVQTEYWTSRMRPYEGSVEFLSEIGQDHRLHFITARVDEGPIRRWVYRQLYRVPRENIVVLAVGSFQKKVEALKSLGMSFFIEDRLETCYMLKEAGITPIVYEQPWNQDHHGFLVVKNWKEIRRLFQRRQS